MIGAALVFVIYMYCLYKSFKGAATLNEEEEI